jgi:hypothetical protein
MGKHTKRIKWHLLLDEPPIPFLPLTCTKDGVCVALKEVDIDESIAYGYRTLQNWFIEHS